MAPTSHPRESDQAIVGKEALKALATEVAEVRKHADAALKSEIEAAEDGPAHLEAIRARLNLVRSPFRTAEKYGIEDIIDPRETRPLLCEFAGLAWGALGAT